ncbi:RING-type E3 ubiquitin transferase [Sarracenia purpurea var. burkii]
MDDNPAGIAATAYYTFNAKLMLISLGFLLALCITIALYHSYTRWVHHQRRHRQQQLDDYHRRHRPPRADYLVFNVGSTVPDYTTATSPPRKGLERTVLKSLPTFFYDAAAHGAPPPECAVCLSEFRDNDLIRLLPKCNHLFHIVCIDMWFYSHTSCPLCRIPVKPLQFPVKTVESAAVTGIGSGSDLCPTCQRNEDQLGDSSSSTPPRENEGVTLEIVDPGLGNPKEVVHGSDNGNGFNDPGGQVGSSK